MRVLPGRPYPLGSGWDGEGVNFALFSENATAVELCLFDQSEQAKGSHRIRIDERTDQVWHAYLPEVRPGQMYGYRVHGPYEPTSGHRFNPSKLLIDPYAKALSSTVKRSDAMFAYSIGDPQDDLVRDDRDNAASIPKSIVIEQVFTWGDDRLLRTPWDRTIIYEVQVKGLRMHHPDVSEDLRGTYAGLASPVVVEYLQSLGVTAVGFKPRPSVLEHGPSSASAEICSRW